VAAKKEKDADEKKNKKRHCKREPTIDPNMPNNKPENENFGNESPPSDEQQILTFTVAMWLNEASFILNVRFGLRYFA
jgi:hypothetical protein